MSNLGRIVVVAGPNGAGKTRLLSRVEEWAYHAQVLSFLQSNPDLIARERVGHLETIHKSGKEHLEASISIEGRSASAYIHMNVLDLVDPMEEKRSWTLEASERLSNSVGPIPSCTTGYLQAIYEAAFNESHPESVSRHQQTDARTRRDSLASLLESLLGESPRFKAGHTVELFGRPVTDGLSDGQKAVLHLAVALHCQKAKLENAVLVIDEPETHLHPGALLEFFERLLGIVTEGQIWVGTHSIPLICELVNREPQCLWYMRDSRIEYAGRMPERVLNGLLGDQARVEKLQEFATLPARMAQVRFCAQCLILPSVAEARDGDPQLNQMRDLIGERGPVRLLDWGAGRGRLADALQRSGQSIDYVAYDPDPKFAAARGAAIDRLCGEKKDRLFSKIGSLHDSGRVFDVVVLCNVLHEIAPDHWPRLFASHISPLLCATGHVLIVEDERIPIGEKPNEKGFFILGTTELRELFSHKHLVAASDLRGDGRLRAHLVEAPTLRNVTDETVRAAVLAMRSRAHDEISDLRGSPPSWKNGQRLAFWSMMYVNASTFLGH